jgi:hypothetical protein
MLASPLKVKGTPPPTVTVQVMVVSDLCRIVVFRLVVFRLVAFKLVAFKHVAFRHEAFRSVPWETHTPAMATSQLGECHREFLVEVVGETASCQLDRMFQDIRLLDFVQ